MTQKAHEKGAPVEPSFVMPRPVVKLSPDQLPQLSGFDDDLRLWSTD